MFSASDWPPENDNYDCIYDLHWRGKQEITGLPTFLPPRFLPTASISSMKRMQGACFLAMLNMSRTLAGPTPTNISRNSDPETEMNGTEASPAVALARRVLPVPGGPGVPSLSGFES